MATETITLRLVAQDLMSGNVSKAIGKIDTLAKRGGIMGSVFQGVGQSLGQMLNPLGLATQGVGIMTDFLMDAAKAAAEDEQSLTRLNTTLKANVPSWEQYGDAIDQATEDALALAFADDEVRASLNLLIPRTKDVNEALRLNALAMDIARARGMGLEEAAGLVGKAYSGQATALKRAGFAITDTKDATKSLAEVQRQVAGQASAYAGTAKGSYETLDLTIQELTESIGYELLPYLKEFATYVKTDVIPNIDDWTASIGRLIAAAELASAIVPDFGGIGGTLERGMSRFRRDVERTAVVVTGTWGTAMKSISDDSLIPVHSLNVVKRTVARLPEAFRIAVVGMKAAIETGKEGIIKQFQQLAWQTKHPFAEKRYAKWLGEQVEKADRRMQKAAEKGKWGVVAQYRDLKDQIMIEMLTLPGAMARLQRQINNILSDIFGRVTNAVGNVFDLGGGGSGGADLRAGGGPVRAGRPYIVGENEPELFVPSSNGTILNGRQMAAAGLGSGSTVVVNVTHIGNISEAEGDRLAAVIEKPLRRRMARAGA